MTQGTEHPKDDLAWLINEATPEAIERESRHQKRLHNYPIIAIVPDSDPYHADIESSGTVDIRARLTTEHPASSSDQPVLVGEDGTAYGTKEARVRVPTVSDRYVGINWRHFETHAAAAIAAGYPDAESEGK